MLDDVAAYLDSVDVRNLDGAFPAFTFDPAAASSYLPPPVDHPALEPESGTAPAVDVQDLPWTPPTDIARLVRAGELTAAEVAGLYARRIDDWQPEVNAFIEVTLNEAAAPLSGPLVGVPVGLTDLIDVAGLPTTAGSAMMRGRIAGADADCWSALSNSGAVLAGKLNVQEFAAGTTGENARFGWTRNPWDTTRMTGGACGGAGAAVAAGMVSAALGPDPGGSIRVPAAHCGVVALKPTYGAISRRGVLPLTWTLDALGVMAQRVRGVAGIADQLLVPHTPRGRRGRHGSCESAALAGELAAGLDLTFGIPTSWLDMGLDPEVRDAFEKALKHLMDLGGKVREVDVPYAGDILRMHRAIAFSEASASHEPFLLHQADEYGANIRDREEAGRAMLAGDYLKASRIRAVLCRDFSEVWRDVDLILTPTVPVPAAPIGTESVTTSSRGPEPTHTVYTRYLAPFSSLGLPSLSVPCGATTGGLPIGMQLAGPPHAEALLFYAAGAYEATTTWHTRHPVLPPRRKAG
ncbi:amidase [Streptacidiphilus sp. MAP12-16]|uniref:amidase n=1 Tax=Streptacidiphilus sp. MAP12-16 TaxID=3156300 RepID=UPI00351100AB